jgi:hypothetical protein
MCWCETTLGWLIGGAVFVVGLVLLAVGLATTPDGVTNTLAIVGVSLVGGGALLGCLIDRWLDNNNSHAVPREAPGWFEPRPVKGPKAQVLSLVKANTMPPV